MKFEELDFSYGNLHISVGKDEMIEFFDEFLISMQNGVRKEHGDKLPEVMNKIAPLWKEFKQAWKENDVVTYR